MNQTDYELVDQIKSGDRSAFDMLMQKYQSLVYSVAYSFGKTKENAMDISQNVFLKVYQNMDRFRGESQFRTWLMRITHNEGLNWQQKNQRHQHNEELELLELPVSHSPSQEDEIFALENKTMLLRCLYHLNTKYRLAVVLRYFEEMPIREIAQILKCSEGVVKNMLFRSLKKLRQSFEKINEEN